MFGIGAVFFIIIFIMAAVGLIRGPNKELGVTLAVVVVLAVMLQFTNLISLDEIGTRVSSYASVVGVDADDVLRRRTIVWFIFSSAIIITAFLAYHGYDTLAFRRKIPPGTFSTILGGFVGAVNGYFIAGGIWYYLDQLEYPIRLYSWFALPLTEAAQNWVRFLPQNLFGALGLSAIALGLLWLRILK